MVLLTLSKKINQWLGPILLKNGIKARYSLAGGVIRDQPSLDALLLLPIAMKLVSLEAYEDGQRLVQQWMVKNSASTSVDSVKQMVDLEKKDGRRDSEASNGGGMSLPSDLRVQALESYLRPALCPNERWSDVQKWQFNHRLLKWIRSEYLMAKYRDELRLALDGFPSLRRTPQLSMKKRRVSSLLAGKLPFDTEKPTGDLLPESSVVETAFGMRDWSKKKNLAATGKEMARLAEGLGGELIELYGGAMRFSDVPGSANLSKLSLEEIIEAAGGHVATCGSFNALCEEAGIFQLWTKEYIEMLGQYLVRRTERFSGETMVLDVGAGDGLLVRFLREYFESVQGKDKQGHSSKTPVLLAVDDGSWRIDPRAEVANTSVQDAVAQYPSNDRWQVIVLCSWMPMNEDWTHIFRKHRVDEYILIGECDDGQCGDHWDTWGNELYLRDIEDELSSEAPQDDGPTEVSRPYEDDGYKRKDLDEFVFYQFSRFDCKVSKTGRTVSFRRRRR